MTNLWFTESCILRWDSHKYSWIFLKVQKNSLLHRVNAFIFRSLFFSFICFCCFNDVVESTSITFLLALWHMGALLLLAIYYKWPAEKSKARKTAWKYDVTTRHMHVDTSDLLVCRNTLTSGVIAFIASLLAQFYTKKVLYVNDVSLRSFLENRLLLFWQF